MYLLIPSKVFDDHYYGKGPDREEIITNAKAVIITESYSANDIRNEVPLTSDFYPWLFIDCRHDRNNYQETHLVYFMNDIQSVKQESTRQVYEYMTKEDIQYFKDKYEISRLLRATDKIRKKAHEELKAALIKLLSKIIQDVKRLEVEDRKANIMAAGEDYAV